MHNSDLDKHLFSKLKDIRLLALDVDGVLTDGSIIYSSTGEEIKVFNVKDGLGIRLLSKAGIPVCVITGRRSRALRHRCDNLRIEYLYDGIRDKTSILPILEKESGISAHEIAFMGDDLPDLPLMKIIGLSVSVADARPEVTEAADWVTSAKGGTGAVREICEMILKAKGLWGPIAENYL
jgi:3-deoxy-D-manno-octulosonate 8-phosphate phosphatase (KDO 8-P phosphatase)